MLSESSSCVGKKHFARLVLAEIKQDILCLHSKGFFHILPVLEQTWACVNIGKVSFEFDKYTLVWWDPERCDEADHWYNYITRESLSCDCTNCLHFTVSRFFTGTRWALSLLSWVIGHVPARPGSPVLTLHHAVIHFYLGTFHTPSLVGCSLVVCLVIFPQRSLANFASIGVAAL